MTFKKRGGYSDKNPGWIQDLSSNRGKILPIEEEDVEKPDGRRVHFRRHSKKKNRLVEGKELKRVTGPVVKSSSSGSSSSSSSNYSLKVEEPGKVEQSRRDSIASEHQQQNGSEQQSECCKIAMEDHERNSHQHKRHKKGHNHHHHHHRQAPIIVVPPINDESTRCNCQNCQFFSGWFCCIPLAIVAFAAVLITWLVLRNRSVEWTKPSDDTSFFLPPSMNDGVVVERVNDTIRIGQGETAQTEPWYKSLV